MPLPIKPVHTLEEHSELFDYDSLPLGNGGMSSLQMSFLGDERTAARVKCSPQMISMLEAIAASEDELLTVAQALAHNTKANKAYRVPRHIDDHQLLSLKAQGFIAGSGRVVSLTDQGRAALRDAWLKEDNTYRANRAKDHFDWRTASEGSSKMTRVAQEAMPGTSEEPGIASYVKPRETLDMEAKYGVTAADLAEWEMWLRENHPNIAEMASDGHDPFANFTGSEPELYASKNKKFTRVAEINIGYPELLQQVVMIGKQILSQGGGDPVLLKKYFDRYNALQSMKP